MKRRILTAMSCPRTDKDNSNKKKAVDNKHQDGSFSKTWKNRNNKTQFGIRTTIGESKCFVRRGWRQGRQSSKRMRVANPQTSITQFRRGRFSLFCRGFWFRRGMRVDLANGKFRRRKKRSNDSDIFKRKQLRIFVMYFMG